MSNILINQNGKSKMGKKRFKDQGPMPIIYFTSIAFEFIGFLFLPAIGGYILDTMVFTEDGDSPSWFFIGGVFLGFSYGIYHLYSVAKDLSGRKFKDAESPFSKKKHQDVNQDAKRIHKELDELGAKIDSAIKKRRK
jgi:F0F1-type ATP synthase assembly protein I